MSDLLTSPDGRPADCPRVLGVRCQECGRALRGDAIQCTDCEAPKPDDGWPQLDLEPDPWLGRNLDERYLLTRLLGRGTSGSVYRAESPNAVESYAAKIIQIQDTDSGFGSRHALERIVSEIKLLVRVRSPHVVKFVDALKLPGSSIAVISSLVDGRSLQDILDKDGALDTPLAVELARQVAIGLSEVHRLGAVHRDLKPENILVQTLHRDDPFAFIIDFGIVRLQDEMRKTSGFIGTPLYSSPEQAMGDDVTPASDIYALGAVLFAMLTGRPPFPGRTPSVVLKAHVRDPRPTLASTGTGPWPPELEALVADLLARDPADRPSSMSAVADRLGAYLREISAPNARDASRGDDPPRDSHESPSRRRRRRGGQTSALSSPGARLPSGGRTPPRKDRRRVDRPVWTCDRRGRTLAVRDKQIVLYDDRDGSDPRSLLTPGIRCSALAISGDTILAGLVNGELMRVSVDGSAVETVLHDSALAPISAVGLSEDARTLVVAGGPGRVRCKVGDRDWEQLPAGPTVTALAVDATTGGLAIGRADSTTSIVVPHHRVWEFETTFWHANPPLAIYFSDDGYLLATALKGNSVEVYDVQSGRHVRRTDGCTFTAATQFQRSPLDCCGRGPSTCKFVTP